MREWKRILLSPVWLGVLALLVVCHAGLYLRTQSEQVGGNLSVYSRETNRWGDILSELPLDTAVPLLEQEAASMESWQAAWDYTYGGYVDESWAELYQEAYPDFSDKVRAIQTGTEVEDCGAAANALRQWQRRLSYQAGYAYNIDSVVQQAQRIRSNPLFAASGSFDYRNAARTEADYAAIADVPMILASDDIINSYLQNKTALIFGLCLMGVTVVLILEPRRLGVEQVERSASGGRSLLTLWRLGAILLAALVGTLAIQGSTLICGMLAYGRGLNLALPVQALEFFQSWTWRTPLGVFLLWHLALRWAGLALAGLLFWLLLSRIRSLPLGLVVCGVLLLIEFRWFTAYGVNDAGYPLAAVNLFHLLSPEDLAGRYLNYNLLGYPVRERTLMTVILLLLLVLCAGGMVLTAHFSRGVRSLRFLSRWLQRAGEWLRAHRRPWPLWIYEGRKVLLYSGGILLLAAVCAFLWTRQAPSSYQQQEEALLTQFVRLYAGEVTQSKLEEIQDLRQEADEAYKSVSTAGVGGDTRYLAARSWALNALEDRCQDLLDRQSAGERGLKLVDEQPLERIFGYTGQQLRLTEACAALLGLCLAIPGLFALEHKNGMGLTLRSAPRGRSVLWKHKLGLALGMGGFLWLAWTGRELWLLNSIGFNWGNLTAAGASLDYWNAALGGLPLWGYLVLFYLLRLVGLLGGAAGMLFLSARFPALLTAGGIGAAVLLLPALLSLVGAGWLSVVSWAVALSGWNLVLGWKALLWLLVWIVCGGVSLWVSRWEWRRYQA